MKKMIITMVAMLTATHVLAQQNYQKAFQKTIENNEVTILSRKDYKDQPTNPSTYCLFTEFSVPLSKKSLVEQIEAAFVKDQATAYSTYIKKPKSGIQNTYMNYVYGPQNEYSVQLGTKSSHNYYGACFTDPNDSLRRHAYCFVWYEENKTIHCFYYHIYGLMPDKQKGIPSTSLSLSQEINDQINNALGKQSRFVLDGNLMTIESFDKNGSKTVSQLHLGDKETEVTNDIEFMSQFGLLRAAFLDAIKDADNKVMTVGIATKIMTLCKQHAKLLVADERTTCVNTLASMQKELMKATPDEFVFGMLKQAQNYVNKK